MDPISIAVTILAIYGMLQRSPQWAGEMAEEWRAARRGEESPAAAARRKRLIDAGVDPATGGPMRQYLGNRWRDYWLDADQQAAKRRADRLAREAAGESTTWWERVAARMDDEVSDRAAQWRTRPPADHIPPVSTAPEQQPGPTGPGAPLAEPDAAADPEQTSRVDDTTSPRGSVNDGDPHTDPSSPPGEQQGVFSGWMRDAPAPDPTPEPDRGPIRVAATVGEHASTTRPTPSAAPAAITAGGTMSNAVAPQAVTGVVSGAAEARAIQAALAAATEEYVKTLNRLRNRIYSLGEQTLSTVQMSGRSQVVASTAAAAEAAAAATANARACTAEVEPLLGSVARAFDRINS